MKISLIKCLVVTKRAITNKVFLISAGIASLVLLVYGLPRWKVDGYTYQHRVGDKVEWELSAEKTYHDLELESFRGEGIQITFFGEDDRNTVITGEEFIYLKKQRYLEVRGKVSALFPNGFRVESDFISYLSNQRRFEIPLSFEVKGHGIWPSKDAFRFLSLGFDLDQKTYHIQLKKKVRFEIDSGSEAHGKSYLEADTFNIFQKRGLVQLKMSPDRPFSEQFIVMKYRDVKIKARTAELIRLPTPGQSTQLTLKKDLSFQIEGSQPPFSGSAQRLSYSSQTGILKFTEFPRVVVGENVFTGEAIYIDRNNDSIQVKHANSVLKSIKELEEWGH